MEVLAQPLTSPSSRTSAATLNRHSVHILNSFIHFGEGYSLHTTNYFCQTTHSLGTLFPWASEQSTLETCFAEASHTTSPRSAPRPLIDPSALSNEMTISTPPVPVSPLGLTHSRSSSFRASSFYGADASLPDFNYFEDISLTKEVQLDHRRRTSDDAARSVPLTMKGDVPATPLRDLTVGDRRHVAHDRNAQGKKTLGLGPANALVMPAGTNTTRKFSTSSGLARRAMSNHSRSRSPSPSAAPSSSILPQSAPLAHSRQLVSPPMMASIGRRGSWQPNRRTAKELEEEYDDMDGDLPDDASLWNVPLSPRPSIAEIAIVRSTSPTNAPWNTKLERKRAESPASGRRETHPSLQTPIASIPAPSQSSVASSVPESPRRDSRRVPSHTLSSHSLPPKSRAKSWTVAMSELSEDAQQLTEALEALADSSLVNHRTSRLKPLSNDLQRAKTSIDLPPLRTDNLMIDPLPISVEKERVLSRTRPSWLPPKSQKEERKHLKEYRRMMELSLQAGMILPILQSLGQRTHIDLLSRETKGGDIRECAMCEGRHEECPSANLGRTVSGSDTGMPSNCHVPRLSLIAISCFYDCALTFGFATVVP